MTAQIIIDQYKLDIEYSYEQGDSFHCCDWLDIDIIAGMIELDEHYDYEMVDMSRDECQDVQDRFGKLIEKRLIEEIGYGS